MAGDSDLKEILSSIDELASRGKVNRQRAFAAWFAINFFNLDEDEALEGAAADGGNDQGIDLAFADHTAEEIIVIQAHCPANTTKITPKEKWDAVLSSIPFVKDPSHLAKSGRKDLAETLNNIKEEHPDYPINAGLITLGLHSQQIQNSYEAHKAQSSDASYFYFSQQEIISRYRFLVSSENGIAEDILQFSGNHIEDKGEYGRAWIGSVNAAELQRLHKKYQDDLFSGNIRLFLGARKGGINEQIIKTAQDSPGIFWALNNGITIVADTAEPADSAETSTTLRLKRFSIVNGCQTTSSLVQAKASADAKVLARVIAAKTSIRNDIVRYNNSQNAVKIWSVRSADDFQKSLREEFKKVGIDYAPKQEGSRRRKDPSIIELDKVTQYLASFENEYLIQAIANKGELFDQPYQKLYYKGIKAPIVYLAWLTGSIADTERLALFNSIEKDETSGLLGMTSSYWIIYATKKLIDKFTNLASPHITLEKMRHGDFSSALNKYVSKATDIFYEAAIDTYERDEYGSFKATLRSSKFLQKMDGKLNFRVARLNEKALPDLAVVCRSTKL